VARKKKEKKKRTKGKRGPKEKRKEKKKRKRTRKKIKKKKGKRRGTRKKKGKKNGGKRSPKRKKGTRKKKRKRKKEMKPAHIVGFEALVVGMCLALMFYAGTRIAPRGTLSTVAVAFVCGALFHIACEIFGVNAWYARTYFSNEL
jgi:Flp pilus assembly protein TadB